MSQLEQHAIDNWLAAGNTVTVIRPQRRYKYGRHGIYLPGCRAVKRMPYSNAGM